MSDIARKPKKERELIARAADLLRKLGHEFPSNPCDTKALFFVAKAGEELRSGVTLALDEIVAGPHADFDYLKAVAERLDSTEVLWDRRVKEYMALPRT